MTATHPIQSRFIFLLYFLLRTFSFPLLVLYFLYRGWRDNRYLGSFAERIGALPASFHRTLPGSIWLHAVSVGEVLSAIRLIQELRQANPGIPIYVSTATLAGHAIAGQKAASLVDGIFYAPIDYRFAVRRVLRAIRPAVLVVLETEIWPVLYREAKRAQCELIVLNGRISDRAIPRYRRLRWFFTSILVLPDAIFVQSERDLQRYVEAGGPQEKIHVFGNLKYDAAPIRDVPPPYVRNLLDRVKPAELWIAASTMPGLDASDIDEDDVVVAAYRELAAERPGLLTILAPRRPDRFDLVASKLQSAGIPFARRSCDQDLTVLPGVLLLDTIGELASLFPLADVVFMGGTFPKRGGHNVLEPAICAKPIVVGPHMENFAAIAADFRSHDAWLDVADPTRLAKAVNSLLNDPSRRAELGRRAAGLAVKNTGVARRAAAEVLKRQDLAIPQIKPPLPWPLPALWRIGSHIHQSRAAARMKSLERPVISIGGISMGGTGKTPFVELLAARLSQRGFRPAILTRGYRRRSSDKTILIEAGKQVSTWQTGDEAQIFVRSGIAHVGIGADRWSTGRELMARFPVDVFLLDDGFQHRRLKRDLDIVLIDALDPFATRRMREPLSGLVRAGVFVITRTQPGRNYAGIRQVLRSINPTAPIFLAKVAPAGWVPERPSGDRVAAFCGLGNPDAFWQTLREQGFNPVFTRTFGDHHRYSVSELQTLACQAQAHNASALVTTEKDAMNLPEGAAEVNWLKIATIVDDEAALMDVIMRLMNVE